MNNRRRSRQPTDAEILAAVEPVRRVTMARVGDADRADDVVQETVARILAVRDRLDPRALTPYALSVARNLLASEHRERAMYGRHAPRLYQREEADPEAGDLVERREEASALRAALASLSAEDRRLVCRKEVEGKELTALAKEFGSTAQALAARMARLRARLRVDYLLNLRRITLPTPRCRAVLVALSLGAGRRHAASTRDHLATCPTCADLAEIVEARRRPIAGILPVGPVLGWWAWLRRAVAKHPWQASVSAASVAGIVAIAIAIALHHPAAQHRPAAQPAATVSPPRSDIVTVHARVVAVPADEGFWIAVSGGRTWVQMTGAGESGPRIRPGLTVTFTGRRVSHRPGFARNVGLPPGPDATALDAQGSHLEVPQGQVRVGP